MRTLVARTPAEGQCSRTRGCNARSPSVCCMHAAGWLVLRHASWPHLLRVLLNGGVDVGAALGAHHRGQACEQRQQRRRRAKQQVLLPEPLLYPHTAGGRPCCLCWRARGDQGPRASHHRQRWRALSAAGARLLRAGRSWTSPRLLVALRAVLAANAAFWRRASDMLAAGGVLLSVSSWCFGQWAACAGRVLSVLVSAAAGWRRVAPRTTSDRVAHRFVV